MVQQIKDPLSLQWLGSLLRGDLIPVLGTSTCHDMDQKKKKMYICMYMYFLIYLILVSDLLKNFVEYSLVSLLKDFCALFQNG